MQWPTTGWKSAAWSGLPLFLHPARPVCMTAFYMAQNSCRSILFTRECSLNTSPVAYSKVPSILVFGHLVWKVQCPGVALQDFVPCLLGFPHFCFLHLPSVICPMASWVSTFHVFNLLSVLRPISSWDSIFHVFNLPSVLHPISS